MKAMIMNIKAIKVVPTFIPMMLWRMFTISYNAQDPWEPHDEFQTWQVPSKIFPYTKGAGKNTEIEMVKV